MTSFMYALSGLAAFVGCLALLTARSAVHELVAGVAFVIAAVLLGAGAVRAGLDALRRDMRNGTGSSGPP